MPTAKKRSRADEIKARGKRQLNMDVSLDVVDLIDRVREVIAADLGSCSQTQAAEKMLREGGRVMLARPTVAQE